MQVVQNLLPERYEQETYYVWAMLRTLETPLITSSKNRWPVTWSVDNDDLAFFKSDSVQRDQRHPITRNDKNLSKDVLVRLRTVVDWIMAQQVAI